MRVSDDVEFNLCACVQHLFNKVELSFGLSPGYDLRITSKKTRPQISIWQTLLWVLPPPPPHYDLNTQNWTEGWCVPDCFKHPSGVVRPWDLPTDHGTRWVGDKERAVLVMGCGAERGDGRGDQHLPATSAAWASAASPPASQTDKLTAEFALYLLTRTLTEDSVVLVPLNSPQHPSTGSAVESEILGWSV